MMDSTVGRPASCPADTRSSVQLCLGPVSPFCCWLGVLQASRTREEEEPRGRHLGFSCRVQTLSSSLGGSGLGSRASGGEGDVKCLCCASAQWSVESSCCIMDTQIWKCERGRFLAFSGLMFEKTTSVNRCETGRPQRPHTSCFNRGGVYLSSSSEGPGPG